MSEEEMEEFDTREAARKRLQARQARLGTTQEHYDTSALRGVGAADSPLQALLQNKQLLLIIVAAIVLLIFIVFGVRSCAAQDSEQQTQTQDEGTSTGEVAAEVSNVNVDQTALSDLLGEDTANSLISQAASNDDLKWIAENADSYATDGDAVQTKLLTLATNEPAAVGFVREWPDKYPQEQPSGDASTPSEEGSQTKVPRLYQWDTRWGYTVYSSTTFALTGCCPTAFAMVYQGVTGNTDKSPYDMGEMAGELGYATDYNGTEGTFLSEAASQLGFTCSSLDVVGENISTSLNEGNVLILNVGPGDFTTSGHYIVACGLTDDGHVIINDPYSSENSNKTWELGTLVGQTKAIYSFSA